MRLQDNLAKILIPSDRLQARIYELGAQLSQDYGDTRPLLVCVLKGGVMFLSDLSRTLSIPHELDFMAISSYGGKRVESSGVVRILMDLNTNIEQRHVLIVEDIIDTGRTLYYIRETFQARNPASVKICALLNKPERREVEIPLDYVGFDIPNEFVVGYGLDFDELYRNLPYIGVLKPEMYS
ncbi:MAG: hypoxanthine phosphoribosyltransferase [Chloroflexi bacterium UTCFX4]|jgi:hypoxanthine phosphoribosyltransferase|nr:MAG: hypoxanthine phosphoribosyltransferase [Chloroflexi bacterium UTCFX4]